MGGTWKKCGTFKMCFSKKLRRERKDNNNLLFRPTVLITAHYMRLKALVEFQVKKVCILIIKSERGGVSY